MSDFGVVTEAGTVRFERLLPGPIERVWAYITDSEKRGTWLATGAMDLRPGGPIELHFKHADLSPEREEIPANYKQLENGVSFSGEVTRCEPPRLLSHTWGEGFGAESEVTYELTPRGDEVLLVLTHRRLPATMMVSASAGWHTHLAILLDRLNDKVPGPFWAAHTKAQADYEKRVPSA